MGAGSSTSFSALASNELLKRFVSKDIITYNDPYWNTLLSFASRVPRNSGDARLLDESIQPLFAELVKNLPLTGNLATLLSVLLARAVELKESAQCENSVFVWQAHNALFIVRVIVKLLLELQTEEQALQLLQHTIPDDQINSGQNSSSNHNSLLQRLLQSLTDILVDLPLTPSTYCFHVEAITCLTVLLSAHVCVPTASNSPAHIVFSELQRVCSNANRSSEGLVLALLHHIINRPPPPPDSDSSSSFVAGLAAGLWSVLTLGLANSQAAAEQSSTTDDPVMPVKSIPLSPLSDQSLLLLLVLATHTPDSSTQNNVFRHVLFTVKNTAGEASASEEQICIPYTGLYKALTLGLHREHVTLLLYLIMHNNPSFRAYLLSLTDLEVIVLPLLQTLHFAQKLSSHHVYMALIIILMFSEDTSFNAALHHVPVASVPWYCERPLYNLTLGDLLILVLIRTITYNMTKMRDRYLHSNCLAALANMSSQFRSLHPYVCQRIMGLLETLSRRHSKVCRAIREQEHCSNGGVAGAVQVSIQDDEEELLSDLSVIEEVLRMVLEILNSTLTHQLCHNPQLLYTLLYKRQVFLPFSTQPNFSDVCMNIDVVLNYLMNRLEKTTTDPSVSDVQEVIEQGVLQLPKDRLRKFPELKFKYVEESSPEEFFIPYVWTLVYQSAGLYWPSNSISLFDPHAQDS